MKKYRFISLGLCLTLLVGIITSASPALAAPISEQTSHTAENAAVSENKSSYQKVQKEYCEKNYVSAKADDIVVPVLEGKTNENSALKDTNIAGRDHVLEWNGNQPQWIEWSFDISEPGLYQIEVEYWLSDKTTAHSVRSFEIDGKSPFEEAETLTFYQMFTDKNKPSKNAFGDEISPSQKAVSDWRVLKLCDSLGMYDMPYQFYFEKGTHTFKMNYAARDLVLSEIRICPAETVRSYAEVSRDYQKNGYKEAIQDFTVEAESNISCKSTPIIRMQNDSDPTCTPRNDNAIVMNTLNGLLWKEGNGQITWNIDVPESGLYKISMRVKQAWGDGLPVFRKIEIDGEVPFSELLQYTFDYDRNWQTETLADKDGNPYLFYLKKGSHTLTMTVKLSRISEMVQSVKEDMQIVSDMLLNIKMITGNDPDPNYEYRLEQKIPNLLLDINHVYQSVSQKAEQIASMSKKRPPAANAFAQVAAEFKVMFDEPDLIARKLPDIENALETLGSWYTELQVQPLGMDCFVFSSPKTKIKNVKASAWDIIVITAKNFIRSFVRDYSAVDITANGNVDTVLNVWIGRGKEWGQCLKELAEDDFTATTNTALNINVIPAGQLASGGINTLLLAVAAGNEPDVAMGVAANTPVEFAIRGVLEPLSDYPQFKTMKNRFLDGVMTPFEYNGGYYAIPETMNFKALLYRKDIIQKLGIMVPDTWNDIYDHVLPALYQNNLEFFCASGDYTTFLFQHGGNFYTEDGKYSALDTPEAYEAFKEWTELFTTQGIPITANFYNRFRTGSMPMGIGGYAEYMTLVVAAPELAGRIGMAPMPGHLRNGVVDRSSGGYADTAAIIFGSSQNKEQAVELLNWWTQENTQVQYGKSLEAIVGTESRWNSANVNAFFEMSWSDAEKEVINESFKWAKEMPIVLGGYYTSRHITNAWNRAVISKIDARDSLEEAVLDINRELQMRRDNS